MTPITHFLASWSMADTLRLRARDLTLATFCGILPDADGLGVVVDGANRVLGRPDSWYYAQYHHAILHGLPAAVAIPLALSLFAARRVRMFVVGMVVVHLHFLCDVVGSRGPGADDIWPLPYLAPFSDRLTIHWSGQWPLDAWPNIVFTVFLLVFALFRAIDSGYSPVGVFNSAAERAFITTVRRRWNQIRREWPRR
jgi:LexA-binding, inner membrane-associated putative hydrolase